MSLGGIEAGGTKWVCAVSDESGGISQIATFPTTTPDETLGRAAAFFKETGPLRALGIGSFGPIDLDSLSPTWGNITTTPKSGWTDIDIVSPLKSKLKVPIALDTDVNAAALGEWSKGAATGLEAFCYVTVGTGIGAGTLLHGEPYHGLLHPEFGHIRIPHNFDRDRFEGACKFHKDCLDGLASGESMRQRWGLPAEQNNNDQAWDLEAEYLALGLTNLVCTLSPERIVIGGGVLKRNGLLPKIRNRMHHFLTDYFRTPEFETRDAFDQYLVSPVLGDDAGVIGAIELSKRLIQSEEQLREVT